MPAGRLLRRLSLLGACTTLVLPAQTLAAVALDLRGEVRLEVTPVLHLVAANSGDEAADDVVPEVVYQRHTYRGETAVLGPGARREWSFALAVPPGPGTFPVTVRAGYRDGSGRAGATPLVTLVRTLDAPRSPIRASLELQPVSGRGAGQLRLENPDAQPVAGRVAFILPGGLYTEPESLPAQVAAGNQATVPFVLENRGARPATYPIFAVFEYLTAGARYCVVARQSVAVTAGGHGGRVLPLVVGAAALATTLALLAFASRRAAARA
jgi:hypothetical protein